MDFLRRVPASPPHDDCVAVGVPFEERSRGEPQPSPHLGGYRDLTLCRDPRSSEHHAYEITTVMRTCNDIVEHAIAVSLAGRGHAPDERVELRFGCRVAVQTSFAQLWNALVHIPPLPIDPCTQFWHAGLGSPPMPEQTSSHTPVHAEQMQPMSWS